LWVAVFVDGGFCGWWFLWMVVADLVSDDGLG
jgi:hypothetical protein